MKRIPIKELLAIGSSSGQFASYELDANDQIVRSLETEHQAWRKGVNACRDAAREAVDAGGKKHVFQPQVYIYDVLDADGNLLKRFVNAPVEYFGLESKVKEVKPKPEKPVKEVPVDENGAPIVKKTRKPKRVDTAGTTSGSETLPPLTGPSDAPVEPPTEAPNEG